MKAGTKLHTLLCLALAVLLLCALPLSALAATHIVTSKEEMKDVFSTDKDRNVTINVATDSNYLDMESDTLTAGQGQRYTINANGNTLYNLSFDGNGSVIVNADEGLIGNSDGNYDALTAKGNVSVTVYGNINADEDGVDANDYASVTVYGNIEADEDGVDANDYASVTVYGNIEADDDGVDADDYASVTVYGNIEAGDDGVYADDYTRVSVTGNVSGGYYGVYAGDDSRIAVGGQITGEGADVELSGNATVEKLVLSTSMPALNLYARDLTGQLWTNESLAGYEAVLLVYIDPADDSAAELIASADAMKQAYGEKLLVLGVLLGTDEAAARALNADFPILRSNADLTVFYGSTTPGMLVMDSAGSFLVQNTDSDKISAFLTNHLA